jgi:hypothetical protein
MFRVLRLCLYLVVPILAIGVPMGLMLGDYAKGDAAPAYYAGYTKPDQGSNLRSAVNADSIEPAMVSYASQKHYPAASGWSY